MILCSALLKALREVDPTALNILVDRALTHLGIVQYMLFQPNQPLQSEAMINSLVGFVRESLKPPKIRDHFDRGRPSSPTWGARVKAAAAAVTA